MMVTCNSPSVDTSGDPWADEDLLKVIATLRLNCQLPPDLANRVYRLQEYHENKSLLNLTNSMLRSDGFPVPKNPNAKKITPACR